MVINDPRELFSPLKLGPITLENRLIQGPLAGYSSAPFRVMACRYGNPGFAATEMISSRDMLHRKVQPPRYLWRDPEEKIVCYQLSGYDPSDLARATEIVSEAGADIVDLNCGCPVKKIRIKGSGSKLLVDPERIHSLVKAMKASTDAAVSIKIRVGSPHYDSDDCAIAEAAESAGADFITVHGRHWRERYDVPCRHDEIAKVANAVTIPVFANGDVEDGASAIKILQATQCAGIMIARASVGNPWLFQKIRSEITGEAFNPPSFPEIAEVFREHVSRLGELENETLAVLQSRKLAKYYSRYHPKRTEFVVEAQRVETMKDFNEVIDRWWF